MALATATPGPAPPATPTGATSHDHFGTCPPCHPTCHPACCAPRQPATHRAAGSARGRPATGPGTFALFRPAHCPASTAAAGGALSSAPARDRAANADGPGPALTYVNDRMPGWRRVRRGKGFSYVAQDGKPVRDAQALRSEEHTSELQSPCNLVCRLLLEKKKDIIALTRAFVARCSITPSPAVLPPLRSLRV